MHTNVCRGLTLELGGLAPVGSGTERSDSDKLLLQLERSGFRQDTAIVGLDDSRLYCTIDSVVVSY